jgi:4-amino-4-deoxy-L-arabinose transferase-like glycosyltransferase
MADMMRGGGGRPRGLLIWYGLATVFAVVTYFYGLDSEHIPKNGDEYPYEHITRTTAASGRWLPLQSDLPQTRYTKPPLLFWQGIWSTDWGRSWTLWDLRWPSVIYTLLTAAMTFQLGRTLAGRVETGFLALLTFLAFFSTYRYGRPFLTDSPSVFWLFVPCFVVLNWRRAGLNSRLIVPLLLGLSTGIGLLYKSFTLLLPVALWLSLSYLRERDYRMGLWLWRDGAKLAIVSVVALAVFSVWFVLDPNPRAIVDEFVLKENAGKFGAPADYVGTFLWGRSSVWRLVVSYPLNAGALMFPVIAVFLASFKRRSDLSDGERLLWLWVITLFVVFSLPSQRDERYLLPAMPALAVLCALNWERIGARAFQASLITTGAAVLLLAYLSMRLELWLPEGRLYPAGYWALLTFTAIVVVVSLSQPRLVRPCVNVAILLGLASLAAFFHPLDGAAGTYDSSAKAFVKGRTVWVPTNFAAKEEGHRFLLPGADVRGYPDATRLTTADLAARYPLFAVSLPMNAATVAEGRIVGQRLDIRTRHTSSEIVDMLRGRIYENLFVREVLVDTARRPPSTANDARQ